MPDSGFDLASTFVHLGLGVRAVPVPDFTWTPAFLDGYQQRFADDGDEGRLVCLIPQDQTWDSWERHPAGEELVFLVSGRVDIIQELADGSHTVALQPGHAMVNPPNVWHTATVHEPGVALFITPGRGTEGRPR